MTVSWHKVDYGKDTVCCTFLDDNKKKQVVKVAPETLEKVTRKSKNSSTKSDNFIKAKYVIIGFAAAFSMMTSILFFTDLDLVNIDNYTPKQDVNAQYVEKATYDSLKDKNDILSNEIIKIKNNSNQTIITKVEALELEEAELYKRLPSVVAANSTSEVNYYGDKKDAKVISIFEEIEREKIQKIGDRIQTLLNKINYYE